MNTRTISLDIDKRHAIREPITIAQGDKNGTTIAATIYDGGTLVTTSGLTARFRMRLPDGRHFYEKTATWNAASGTATVTIDETQAASAPGTTGEAYFELLSGTTVIHSTSRFSVRVLRSATEGFDPATSYSDRVEELLDGLDELPLPGDAAPVMDGTASVGTSGRYARQDHRHPTDTSRASTDVATTSANGLMSATDKAKLDGIAANANAYELPPATASALGGVKPDGTTITVDSDGTIHGASTYELPTMSASTKGGAKLGDGLAITDGALGIDPEPQESTGAVRGAVSSLTAKGWATQDGTPTPSNPVPIQVARGRNLLDLGTPTTVTGCTWSYDAERNAFTVTSTGTGFAEIMFPIPDGESLSGKPVSLSYDVLSLSNGGNPTRVYLRNSSGTGLFEGTSVVGHFSDTRGVGDSYVPAYVSIRVNQSTNRASGQTCTIANIQLEVGSTPTPYVPYGHVGVEMRGRNVLPRATSTTNNGVTFTVNDDGSITANGTVSGSNATLLLMNNAKMQELPFIGEAVTLSLSGCPDGGGSSTYNIVANFTNNGSNANLADNGGGTTNQYDSLGVPTTGNIYIRIYGSGRTVSNLTFRPQLELGSTAHPYQPYFNETIPVPLPSKGFAASLPDGTADVLTIDGAGKVEWESETNIVMFDGDELGWIASTASNIYYTNLPNSPRASPTIYSNNSMCDKFEVTTERRTTMGDGKYEFEIGSNNSWVYFKHGVSADLAAFKAWLAQNPITVLYPLATPTTEQCGYIDWPDIPDESIISCPELDDLAIEYVYGNDIKHMSKNWYDKNRLSLSGKTVSFIGDSITTFSGYIPNGYAAFYPRDYLNDVSDTWWYQLIKQTGLRLISNCSWSGSRVSGDSASTVSASAASSDKRIADVSGPNNEAPDFIIILISVNDFNGGVPLGEWSYSKTVPENATTNNITDAYMLMIYKLHVAYPKSHILCCTIPPQLPSTINSPTYPVENQTTNLTQAELNQRIRNIAQAMNCGIIDFETSVLNVWNLSNYMGDGRIHPNVKGADIMTNVAKSSILQKYYS